MEKTTTQFADLYDYAARSVVEVRGCQCCSEAAGARTGRQRCAFVVSNIRVSIAPGSSEQSNARASVLGAVAVSALIYRRSLPALAVALLP